MFGANLANMFQKPGQPTPGAPAPVQASAPVLGAPVLGAPVPAAPFPAQAAPAPVQAVAPAPVGNPFGVANPGVPAAPVAAPYQPGPPAPAVSGFFSGMEHAKASEGGNYEREGHYIERINRIKIGRSRKDKDFVAFEKTVIHVFDDGGGRGHKEGEDVTHMVTKTGNDMFFPNMKSIFSALAGCPAEHVTPQIAESIIAQNLCNGMYIECANRLITTKKGGVFTEIKYKKQVTPHELAAILSPTAKARFFPQGELDAAIAQGRPRV
jgi:hypothetical protein